MATVAAHDPLLRAMGSIAGAASVFGSVALILALGPRMRRYYKALSTSTSHPEKIQALRGGYKWTLCWLAVADLIVGTAWGLSAMASPSDSHEFCTVQAVMIEYGVVSSALWTACLSYELYRFTIKLKEEVLGDFAKRRYTIYQLISWGVPVGFTAAAAFLGEFASTGGWCWILNDHTPTKLLLTAMPLVVTFLFMVIVYARIGVWVHRNFKNRMGCCTEVKKIAKLGVFPLVFCTIWIVPIAARVFGSHSDAAPAGEELLVLPIVTALLAPSQGWVNALLFTTINKHVRSQVREACCTPLALRQRILRGDTPSAAGTMLLHPGDENQSLVTGRAKPATADSYA